MNEKMARAELERLEDIAGDQGECTFVYGRSALIIARDHERGAGYTYKWGVNPVERRIACDVLRTFGTGARC
jgi:hypothetical protein